MSRGGRMINIGGDENDASYRYKMPAMMTKIEGRGNGIKTVLTNIVDVAKHLHTQPDWCTKFFGMEVCALSKFDKQRDVGVVHGVHQANDLQKTLKKYINHFVLCPKCKQPELDTRVNSKKSLLVQRCKGCGYRGRNPSTHKVKTFMINHPPKGTLKSGTTKKRSSGGDATARLADEQASRRKERRRRQGSSKGGSSKSKKEDDEEWSVAVDEKAVAMRKKKELESIATKRGVSRASVPEKGPVGVLRNFMLNGKRSTSEIMDELKRIKWAHDLQAMNQMQITMDALLDPSSEESFVRTLSKFKDLFAKMIDIDDSGDSKRFFNCLEEMVARRQHGQLVPKMNKILLAIYEAEIVADEEMIGWFKTETDESYLISKDEADALRKHGRVFIEWLEEQDDDESGDEEDDESGEDDEDSDEKQAE